MSEELKWQFANERTNIISYEENELFLDLKTRFNTKMSAFSGASQQRMSLETMVTIFSQPSIFSKLCLK